MHIHTRGKPVEGQALLVTLIVLAAVSMISIGLVSMCFLVRQSAVYDCRCLQAWQAADAGVEAARCQLLASFQQGEDWPRDVQVEMGNGASAEVSITCMEGQSAAVFEVVSTGRYHGAVREVTARIQMPVEEEPQEP